MKKTSFWIAALALINVAGNCNAMPPDHELRSGLSKAEMEEGPSHFRMKGALLNDVRIWRGLDKRLDEGRPACAAIVTEKGIPICAADKTEIEIFTLREDLMDQPYRVKETVYFCRKEDVYHYRYTGGPRRLDVWLGPYKIERKSPKVSDEK